MFDLRRAARLAVKLRAVYVTSDLVVDGVVDDLSRNGLFLHSSDCDDVGATGQLHLRLPHGDTVQIDTEVVRVERRGGRRGMALRFADTGKWRHTLANFLMERHHEICVY